MWPFQADLVVHTVHPRAREDGSSSIGVVNREKSVAGRANMTTMPG